MDKVQKYNSFKNYAFRSSNRDIGPIENKLTLAPEIPL